MSQYFKAGTRDNGEDFVTVRSDAPDWVRDCVKACHGSDLPNDWIYSTVAAAFETHDEAVKYGTDLDTAGHEFADSQTDPYTRDRYQWCADMCHTKTFAAAEDYVRDMNMPEETLDRLAALQYAAVLRIWEQVAEHISANTLDNGS